MRVLNRTKNRVVSNNAGYAYSFLSRLRGLMLSKPQDIILVSPREDILSSTIHMMFMRFPIDVIWVDSKNTVVDVRQRVPPFNPLKPKTWRTYKPKKPAKYVVELGVGNARETEEGDMLNLKT